MRLQTYRGRVRTRRRASQDQSFSITSVRRGHAEDQRSREVKYLVSMGLRMVCIVLAVVVPGPLRWAFIAGAVVLPYFAVLIANAGREAAGGAPESPEALVPLALESTEEPRVVPRQ